MNKRASSRRRKELMQFQLARPASTALSGRFCAPLERQAAAAAVVETSQSGTYKVCGESRSDGTERVSNQLSKTNRIGMRTQGARRSGAGKKRKRPTTVRIGMGIENVRAIEESVRRRTSASSRESEKQRPGVL